MQRLRFKNYRRFLQYAEEVCSIDYNSSRSGNLNTVVTKDGVVISGKNFRDLLAKINASMGVELFIKSACRRLSGGAYRVCVNEEPKVIEGLVEDTSEADAKALESIRVEVVAETVEVAEGAVESEISIDWDWINTMKSTRDNKDQLETYAKEKIGVDLNKGKKISDMIVEFKEALAAHQS